MESLILVVHVLSAVAITGLVLIQQGKGADMGASFGSGASQTLFGSVGSGNVLTKSTTWLAVLFFVTSLTLAVMARNQADQGIQVGGLLQGSDTTVETRDAGANGAASDLPQLPANAAPEAATSAADIPAAAPEAQLNAPTETVPDPAETVEPQTETTENQ